VPFYSASQKYTDKNARGGKLKEWRPVKL